MNELLSPDTQATLLLTAPLIAGRGEASSDRLTPGEYNRLARFLDDNHRQPGDLLGPEAVDLIRECEGIADGARLKILLDRGFLLSQALDRWQARSIWVVSRGEPGYPARLNERLQEKAPPVLYGCGDTTLLDDGGLAVVGSRHVEGAVVEYTECVGRLTARAERTLISGAARGIDQASMRGALEADGRVVGVLSDGLERAAVIREHRRFLMDGKLTLISPYDPASGFSVGNAMQRNKLIYALADAALVVSVDYEKGGTWAGAVEQIEKFKVVPVFVRSRPRAGKGPQALLKKGALPWPEPEDPQALVETLAREPSARGEAAVQETLSLSVREPAEGGYEAAAVSAPGEPPPPSKYEGAGPPAGEQLLAKVSELLGPMEVPMSEVEVAEQLQVTRLQARQWLHRLVKEGRLKKLSRPVRYQSAPSAGPLFNRQD